MIFLWNGGKKMSEKRFEISKDKYFIFDNIKDDFLDLEDDCELLNKLNEENNRLKFENEFLKMENEEHKDLMSKKLVVTITPTFYGWKSKVEEMGK